jgi:hypothetical protein
MKPLFTSLLLAAGISAGAQTYIPFPTANATWTQRIGQGEADPHFSIIGMKSGDTVLGAQTYHKVYTSSDATLDEADFTGGLREDSKRIYYYDATGHVERLIYDFNVAVGDTIKNPVNGAAVGIVDHIDSILISGTWHKRFNFHLPSSSAPTWAGGAWIEGIGNSSLGGLLGNPMMQPTCDCATDIVCAQKTSTYDYHNPKYSSLDCIGVLRTEILISDARTVNVFPNPVTGASTIQVNSRVNYSKASVYDLQGKCVKTIMASKENTIPLTRSDYAPGIYIYRLQNDEGSTMSGRFVVE